MGVGSRQCGSDEASSALRSIHLRRGDIILVKGCVALPFSVYLNDGHAEHPRWGVQRLYIPDQISQQQKKYYLRRCLFHTVPF